ncbi:histone-lysine N-methyltransferase SETDB1-A-like isoform X2 [Syngnathus typhle]|uniref:histone-lysine N-methyltransferase SETDB1-A-like isoform X2 n=1 Tax=Syngnathus typhle TaxID=161592 RepID=UPI002A6AC001|nr:histone-lysine N-methyltransferase SETDB1-A-like isoform X2 [Syngnathus typhle]
MDVTPTNLLEQRNAMKSQLEKCKKQRDRLLELSNSATAYETVVKELYAFLGWKYTDTDSDDDVIEISDGISRSPSYASEIDVCNTPRSDSPIPNNYLSDIDSQVTLTREATKVLSKMSKSEIPGKNPADRDTSKHSSPLPSKSSPLPSKSDTHDSDFGSPEFENSASHSVFAEEPSPKKRRRIPNHHSDSNHSSPVPSESDTYTSDFDDSASDWVFLEEPSPDKRRRMKIKWPINTSPRKASGPPVDKKKKDAKTSRQTRAVTNDTGGNAKTPDTPNSSSETSLGSTASTSKTIEKNTKRKSNSSESNSVGKTKATGPDDGKAKKNDVQPSPQVQSVVYISSSCMSSERSCKVPARVPQAKIKVGMGVLAKKSKMWWQRGKVREMIKVADKVQYLVQFYDKTSRLVSAHHLAFKNAPKLDYLYVGARVVIGSKSEGHLRAGILAEFPIRKNRQRYLRCVSRSDKSRIRLIPPLFRFLAFGDDQTALYVGMPHLHLVCAPLEDPLEDISDTYHREFVKEYIKVWPYPPLAQVKCGQSLNVELGGVQESCVVQSLDCSLMEIRFVESLREEWIYRGSWRLEIMAKMKQFHTDS